MHEELSEYVYGNKVLSKTSYYFFFEFNVRIQQKGTTNWHENKLTTWSALIDGNTYIMAGLMTAIFQGSPAWRHLAIETGLAGAQGSQPVLTTQLMTSWFYHNNIVRKNAENLICFIN